MGHVTTITLPERAPARPESRPRRASRLPRTRWWRTRQLAV